MISAHNQLLSISYLGRHYKPNASIWGYQSNSVCSTVDSHHVKNGTVFGRPGAQTFLLDAEVQFNRSQILCINRS